MLYDGATVDASVDGMFSFVPCQPLANTTPRGFRRPTIQHAEELLEMRNFGRTSLDEIKEKLVEKNFIRPEKGLAPPGHV